MTTMILTHQMDTISNGNFQIILGTIIQYMEPIVGGWHLVFYLGNFLADTGVAIFAISVWEFDKKIENYKENLSESSVTDAAELNSLTNQYRILVRIKLLKCVSIYLLVIGIIIQLVALLFSIQMQIL